MKKNILFILSAALLFTTACILTAPVQPTEVPNVNSSIATSVALTLAASGQAPPGATIPTPLPTMTQSIPPTVTLTPTIALTATPSVPMASVSVNTNCRTGPGKVYDYIGALTIGEKAEVVGKHTSSNYWVIKNPNANGNCWLWGYYATVAGNTANLQEYIVPPTPTPSIPIAPSNLAAATACAGVAPNFMISVDLIWADNSDNETGFNLYIHGLISSIYPADQTQDAFDFPVGNGIPADIGISAYNGTGESAVQTIQVVCP